MPDRRPHLAALFLLSLVACEDDDSHADDTCMIDVAISGDVTADLPGSDGVACAIQFSGGDGIDVQYLTLTEPRVRVELAIDAVTKGMLGDAFPAELRVADDVMTWATLDCTVDIHEHEFIEMVELGNESYQVRGEGRCASPLTSDGGGTVTLAPFEFAVTVTWTD
jgi:hypothetical protein